MIRASELFTLADFAGPRKGPVFFSGIGSVSTMARTAMASLFTQDADGICATIQSGQLNYESNKASGALPGTLLRGAQPAGHNAWLMNP